MPKNSSPILAAVSSLLESHIAYAKTLMTSNSPVQDLNAKAATLDALLAQARDYSAQIDTALLAPLVAQLNTLRKSHADAVKSQADTLASLGKEKERDEKTITRLAWSAEASRMDVWERGADLVLEVEGLAGVLDGALGDPGLAPFDQIFGGTDVRCGFPAHLQYMSQNLHAGVLDVLKATLSEICNVDRAKGAAEIARAESALQPVAALSTAGEALAALDNAGGGQGIEIKRGRGELALPASVTGLETADEDGKAYLDNRQLRLQTQLSGLSAQALKQSAALPPLPSSPYAIPPLSSAPLAPPQLLPAVRRLSLVQLQMLAIQSELRTLQGKASDPPSLQPLHAFRPLTLSISTTHCDVCGHALLGIGVGTKCDVCGVRCHVGACEMRVQAKCPGKGQKAVIESHWESRRKAITEAALKEAGERKNRHSRSTSQTEVSPATAASIASTTSPSPVTELVKAQAIYSYTARTSDELSLQEGETIELLGPEQGGWVRARGQAGEGMVPMSYLSTGAAKSNQVAVGTRMKMAYSHTAGGEAEVAAEEGEEVEVVSTEFAGEGWVKVRTASGAEGLVPESFLVSI